MVKRTLIAIALVALFASIAAADIQVWTFPEISRSDGTINGGDLNKEGVVKVDGNEKVFWPYEYKAIDVCAIPIKMEIGMYVDVKDCHDREIILKQVPCSGEGGIGKSATDIPCYHDCENISVRANFDVKLGTRLEDNSGGLINKWEAYYDGGDVILGDGNYHTATVCVQAWKTHLYKGTPGEEVTIGNLYITAKPDV